MVRILESVQEMDDRYERPETQGFLLQVVDLAAIIAISGDICVPHLPPGPSYGQERLAITVGSRHRLVSFSSGSGSGAMSKEYNVDIVSKVYDGEWRSGSRVDPHERNKIFELLRLLTVVLCTTKESRYTKSPATDVEALKSTLMGLFEKRHARKFFIYVQDYDENDPKSHEGMVLNKVTARGVISKYGLDDNTVEFIGHALALQRDDSYLDEPAMHTVKERSFMQNPCYAFKEGGPYMDWENFPRALLVLVLFTVAPTCLTNQNARWKSLWRDL